MKQNLITDVVQAMLPFLNNAQTEHLQGVLQHTLFDYEVTKIENEKKISEQNYVELFLSAKRIEGCSEKSLKYYKATIEMMIATVGKSVKHIETDDIRRYLTEYQEKKKSSKVTIDNIRRILSSFFSWLEDEDYILKSPVRRIHKVKTGTNIKETYSDEALELMRDNCTVSAKWCCSTEMILILTSENVSCSVKETRNEWSILTQGQRYICRIT